MGVKSLFLTNHLLAWHQRVIETPAGELKQGLWMGAKPLFLTNHLLAWH